MERIEKVVHLEGDFIDWLQRVVFVCFSVCNRTYYGDVKNTYHMVLQKPNERKLPFLCHLTFTANGHEFGDIIQVNFYTARIIKNNGVEFC